MESRLDDLLSATRITQTEVAASLGLDSSAVSRKISGERPWKLTEIQGLLAFLTTRLSRKVTYEELFALEPDPSADLVDPELGGEA